LILLNKLTGYIVPQLIVVIIDCQNLSDQKSRLVVLRQINDVIRSLFNYQRCVLRIRINWNYNYINSSSLTFLRNPVVFSLDVNFKLIVGFQWFCYMNVAPLTVNTEFVFTLSGLN